jgi:transcriptional regulator with XRE-family HTH domain
MKKKRLLEESESPLETLRIERTEYSQEEFAKRCGISLRTYMRWISGETKAKLSPAQVKAVCKELNITVEDIPDDFSKSPVSKK